MSAAISNSIVIIAIVVAALYSAWRLGPRRMRDTVRLRLSRILPGVSGNPGNGSTGACDDCGGCAPAATNPSAARKEHAVIWRKGPAR